METACKIPVRSQLESLTKEQLLRVVQDLVEERSQRSHSIVKLFSASVLFKMSTDFKKVIGDPSIMAQVSKEKRKRHVRTYAFLPVRIQAPKSKSLTLIVREHQTEAAAREACTGILPLRQTGTGILPLCQF